MAPKKGGIRKRVFDKGDGGELKTPRIGPIDKLQAASSSSSAPPLKSGICGRVAKAKEMPPLVADCDDDRKDAPLNNVLKENGATAKCLRKTSQRFPMELANKERWTYQKCRP